MTFSQIIDELAISELRRPDMRVAITSYLNQTIRDVHSKRGTRSAIHFGENRVEDELTIIAVPVIWDIPIPNRFQVMEAIYAVDRGVYLVPKNPSIIFRETSNPMDRFNYYRSGSGFVLNGVSLNETIRFTFFQFPKMLTYYAPADRPAVWNPETETFTYHIDYSATPELQANARDLVTHWLIQRHGETLKEGVRAKTYRRLANEIQAKMSYSEFEDLREMIHLSEGVD